MDGTFDPYFKWLAIPAEEQPPNHYRLLGLPLFTSDPDVIENLAEQRIRHVRSYQIGPHSEYATQLLNEIAAARACLLDPPRKTQYDASLRGPEKPPPVAIVPPVPQQPARLDAIPTPPLRPRITAASVSSRRRPDWWKVAIPIVVIVALSWGGAHWIWTSTVSKEDADAELAAADPTESPSVGSSTGTPRSAGAIDIQHFTPPPAQVPDRSETASDVDGGSEIEIDFPPAAAPVDRIDNRNTDPPVTEDVESTEPPQWSLSISTREGRGGDAMVQLGVNQRFGVDPLLGVRTRGGVEAAHSYLRFDLSQLSVEKRKSSDVTLVLTVLGNSIPESGVIRVIGIPEVPWSENLIQWNNSLSSQGLESHPVLLLAPLSGDRVKIGTAVSEIHLSSSTLSDFVADAGSTVTLALAGSVIGDEWLRFTSREHSARFAPRLTFAASSSPTSNQQATSHQQAASNHQASAPSDQPTTFSNLALMSFRLIPAGHFMMGTNNAPVGSDRRPQHRVTLTKSFYISETEVTQSQWERVMGTSPWGGRPYSLSGPDFPATYVSWQDAHEFCRKLSQLERRRYRLPTEAEWEYACRAGGQGRYSFGDRTSQLDGYAWFDQNAMRNNESYAHRVGIKKSNAFGLHDLHGNVWEWCADWYEEGYYGSSAQTDPKGPTTGTMRVLRGGGWGSEASYCASYYRDKFAPTHKSADLGFRVCLDL